MASREHFIALLLAPCADFLSDGFDGDHEARDTFVMAAIGASGADVRVQPVQAQQQSAFEARSRHRGTLLAQGLLTARLPSTQVPATTPSLTSTSLRTQNTPVA